MKNEVENQQEKGRNRKFPDFDKLSLTHLRARLNLS